MTDLSQRLRDGEPVVGSWLSIADPAVAEIVAGADLDFVVVDTEHGPAGLETIENQLRAVAAAPGDTRALARVAWNDPVRIKRLLDTGPEGIVVPMVESAAEARDAVAATRYPPEGERGIGSSRASDYTAGFEDYVETADEALARVVQIESAAGVEAAPAIAAVDGVDALFVGPADLSASLGAFPDVDDAAVAAAIDDVVAAGEDAGVPVGTLAVDPGEAEAWLDRGMDFLVVGLDHAFLADGAAGAAAAFADALDR